jgi:hypothetical protein
VIFTRVQEEEYPKRKRASEEVSQRESEVAVDCLESRFVFGVRVALEALDETLRVVLELADAQLQS